MKKIIFAIAAILPCIVSAQVALADHNIPDSETEAFRSVVDSMRMGPGRSFYSGEEALYYKRRGAIEALPPAVPRANVPDSESAAWRSVLGIPGGY
jgi:hypothetical protein